MASDSASLVVTRTPLRISFAGGGTDLAAFYETDPGAVYSSTIDKYVYVTVKRHGPVFDERIRLNYSVSESVHEIDAIRNNIARECLRLLEIEPPIYVSVISDLPDSSGLGGSSAFAVGLLNALHVYRGERVSAEQLATEASHVEIDLLGEPIGKQDQYAAAYGGLNLIQFCSDGQVVVEPQDLDPSMRSELFSSMIMLWTGHQRRSSSVLTEQRDRTAEHLPQLRSMRDHAFRMRSLVSDGSLSVEAVGTLLHEGWTLKRSLATTVSNARIDEWYDAGRRAGAYGGKLCGAGSGGFLLFVAPADARESVVSAVGGLTPVRVGYEAGGSTVLLGLE